MLNISIRDLHDIVGYDQVTKSKDVYKVYMSYNRRLNMSDEKMSRMIDARLTDAGIEHTMLDKGDVFAGHQNVAKPSKGTHFWVTFTLA